MERMDFGFDHEPNPERAVELQAARAVIQHVLAAGDGVTPTGDGQLERLEEILERAPQLDGNRFPRYLLTSGLAVELLTGFERHHKDIDLVIMGSNAHEWEIWGTDNVTPGQYWADMRFEPEFMADTREVTTTRRNPNAPFVGCVHPAIMVVQKLSDCLTAHQDKRTWMIAQP